MFGLSNHGRVNILRVLPDGVGINYMGRQRQEGMSQRFGHRKLSMAGSLINQKVA